MRSNQTLSAKALVPSIQRALVLATEKIVSLDRRWNPSDGAPVFTIDGRYTARSWTQWTQGFQYGSGLLCFEMTGEQELLDRARANVVEHMAEHLTHIGVHDHGFNNISTYGNLRRLMLDERIPYNQWELRFYELALKSSGAVQAARWTRLGDDAGYIYSFNGSHSLFIDTARTLRICSVAHALGHSLLGEQDAHVNLLERVLVHARTSAQYNIYFGAGRDRYDTPEQRGRTVHEAVFNTASGAFRSPSSQQGYSPFTTWTRGLAWAILGYAEELEFIQALPDGEFAQGNIPPRQEAIAMLERTACATADFYISQASTLDGICYWDTGAPQMYRLGDWRSRVADPYNEFEPVDASASAIAAQGLIRLGLALGGSGESYLQAGLTVAATLLEPPYLSTKAGHEGLLLQSVYHHPNGWDNIPPYAKVPCDESSMWGDYHFLELMLLLTRMAEGSYYTFFDHLADRPGSSHAHGSAA